MLLQFFFSLTNCNCASEKQTNKQTTKKGANVPLFNAAPTPSLTREQLNDLSFVKSGLKLFMIPVSFFFSSLQAAFKQRNVRCYRLNERHFAPFHFFFFPFLFLFACSACTFTRIESTHTHTSNHLCTSHIAFRYSRCRLQQ